MSSVTESVNDNVNKTGNITCGSCYGARPDNECCNTCDDLKEAYRIRGWPWRPRHFFKQCSSDAFNYDYQRQVGEGCKIAGKIEVSKVMGEINFLPNGAMTYFFKNDTELKQFISISFNASHTINKLYFGPKIPVYFFNILIGL